MSKIDSNDLIDIFKEEVTKKNKKEVKKQKKLEKKLEKKENIEFEKLAKKAKEKELQKEESKKKIEKQDVKNESVFAFLYDTTFGFFLILLLFCSIGFIGITLYNDNSLKNIIQMSLIGVFVIFYIISMTTKKDGIRKLSSIIANSAICLEMAYSLYIA